MSFKISNRILSFQNRPLGSITSYLWFLSSATAAKKTKKWKPLRHEKLVITFFEYLPLALPIPFFPHSLSQKNFSIAVLLNMAFIFCCLTKNYGNLYFLFKSIPALKRTRYYFSYQPMTWLRIYSILNENISRNLFSICWNSSWVERFSSITINTFNIVLVCTVHFLYHFPNTT